MALTHVTPRRFNRDEYYKMAESGVFAPGERVELIDGEVIPLAAHNLPHSNAVTHLNQLLVRRFGATHLVRCQLPLTLANDCEPEPGFTLVTPAHLEEANRADRHPYRPDLVIEVSDTSLSYDRSEKSGLYARAQIAEYWVLNLRRRCLEVRRDPMADPDSPFGHTYKSLALVAEAESIAPAFEPGVALEVREMLGPKVGA